MYDVTDQDRIIGAQEFKDMYEAEFFVSTTTDYGYRSYRFESHRAATDYLSRELAGLEGEGFTKTGTDQGPSWVEYTLRDQYDGVVSVRFQKVA